MHSCAYHLCFIQSRYYRIWTYELVLKCQRQVLSIFICFNVVHPFFQLVCAPICRSYGHPRWRNLVKLLDSEANLVFCICQGIYLWITWSLNLLTFLSSICSSIFPCICRRPGLVKIGNFVWRSSAPYLVVTRALYLQDTLFHSEQWTSTKHIYIIYKLVLSIDFGRLETSLKYQLNSIKSSDIILGRSSTVRQSNVFSFNAQNLKVFSRVNLSARVTLTTR